MALEGYQNDNDKEKYLNIAGLNHEPNKNLKRQTCIVEILRLIEQKQISAESYSYLSGLENKIMEVYDPENTGEFYIRYVNTFLSNGYKAVFEIK